MITTNRVEVVAALYDAALKGMRDCPEMEDATANEVFSAVLTVVNGVIHAFQDRGVDDAVLRVSVEQLLLTLREPVKGVH